MFSVIKMAWGGRSSQPQPEAINCANCITNVPILIPSLLSNTVILIWLPVAVRETNLGCLENVLSVLTMTKLSCNHAVSYFSSDINCSTLETKRLKKKYKSAKTGLRCWFRMSAHGFTNWKEASINR